MTNNNAIYFNENDLRIIYTLLADEQTKLEELIITCNEEEKGNIEGSIADISEILNTLDDVFDKLDSMKESSLEIAIFPDA